eukprot:3350724-Alexandrium_andersonii.AAC.1
MCIRDSRVRVDAEAILPLEPLHVLVEVLVAAPACGRLPPLLVRLAAVTHARPELALPSAERPVPAPPVLAPACPPPVALPPATEAKARHGHLHQG